MIDALLVIFSATVLNTAVATSDDRAITAYGRVRRQKKSKRRRKSSRSGRSCSPGANKKFAKVVNGKCIRFGDPNMTIKKDQPGRKRSFCARHRCSQTGDKATARYQSCKKWGCKTR